MAEPDTHGGDILRQIPDLVAAAVALHAQGIGGIGQTVGIRQLLGAPQQADDGTGGGAGAVGVEAAVQRHQTGLDDLLLAQQQGQQGDAHVFIHIGAVRVTVVEQDPGQHRLAVAKLVTPAHRILHQPAELGISRHGLQSIVDEFPDIGFKESFTFQRCKEHLGFHRLAGVIQYAVPGGQFPGQSRIAHGHTAPNLGADGAAHALDIEIIAEFAGIGGIDAPLEIFPHDGVLAGRVGRAAAEPL